MANPYTGEVDIVFGNDCYILRPSFAVLCAIEDKLGKSIYVLLKNYPLAGLTMVQLRAIILLANPEIPSDALGLALTKRYLEISEIVVRFLLGGVGV